MCVCARARTGLQSDASGQQIRERIVLLMHFEDGRYQRVKRKETIAAQPKS
jgi:hypothetical protein